MCKDRKSVASLTCSDIREKPGCAFCCPGLRRDCGPGCGSGHGWFAGWSGEGGFAWACAARGLFRRLSDGLLLLTVTAFGGWASGRAGGRSGKVGKGGQHQRTGGHIVRNTYLKGWGGFASLFGSPVRGLLSYLILSFSAFLFFSFGHLYSYLEFRVRSLLA